jgi:hypothetical protein
MACSDQWYFAFGYSVPGSMILQSGNLALMGTIGAQIPACLDAEPLVQAFIGYTYF